MTSLTGLYSVLKNQFVLTTKSIGAAELEGNESINGINEWSVDDGKMSLKTVFEKRFFPTGDPDPLVKLELKCELNHYYHSKFVIYALNVVIQR